MSPSPTATQLPTPHISTRVGAGKAGSTLPSAVGTGAPPMTATTTSAWQRECDALCHRLGITDLRLQERRWREEADKKQEALRQMVGERYRDLIDAADAIESMSSMSRELEDLLVSLNERCRQDGDAAGDDHATTTTHPWAFIEREWANTVKTTAANASATSAADISHQAYPVAAAMKLLADTPELIWSALERGDRVLVASRVFLVARVIYRYLNGLNTASTTTAVQRDLLNKLSPLLNRQWESVAQFRQQILTRCRRDLETHLDRDPTEHVYAWMLLEGLSRQQALKQFLSLRREVIVRAIFADEQATLDIGSIGERLARGLSVYRRSLSQAASIFMGTQSSLDQITEKLVQESCQDGSALTRLYNSPKCNVHVLAKYLPEEICAFTPKITGAIKQPSSPTNADDELTRVLAEWIAVMDKVTASQTASLMENVMSFRSWTAVRRAVLESMASSTNDIGDIKELLNAANVKFSTDNYSFWQTVLRLVFKARAHALAKPAFDKVLDHLIGVLNEECKRIDQHNTKRADDDEESDRRIDDVDVEFNVGRYQWARNMSGGTAQGRRRRSASPIRSPLSPTRYGDSRASTWQSQVSQGTPLVQSLVNEFDRLVDALAKDVQLLVNEPDDERFGGMRDDVSAIIKEFHRAAHEFLTRLHQSLCSLTHEKSEHCLMAKLFVARVSAEMISLSAKLSTKLTFGVDSKPPISSATATKRPQPQQSPPSMFSSLESQFRRLHSDVYNAWAKEEATSLVKERLAGFLAHHEHWLELGYLITATDPQKPTLSGGTWEIHRREGDTILLPANPSMEVVQVLFELGAALERAGHPPRSVIQHAADHFLSVVFDVYSEAITKQPARWTIGCDKIVLQIYFDYQFLWRSLRGAVDTQRTAQAFERYAKTRDAIRGLVDPVEFTLYEEDVNANVEHAIDRYSLLLHHVAMFSASGGAGGKEKSAVKSPTTTSTSKSFLYEQHHLVCTLPTTSRFALLPTSYSLPEPSPSDVGH